MKPLETFTGEELIDLVLQLQARVAELEVRLVSNICRPPPPHKKTPLLLTLPGSAVKMSLKLFRDILALPLLFFLAVGDPTSCSCWGIMSANSIQLDFGQSDISRNGQSRVQKEEVNSYWRFMIDSKDCQISIVAMCVIGAFDATMKGSA